MYIEMNDEQVSAVIAAMTERMQALESDNEYLRESLRKHMRNNESANAPAEEKPFDRDELEAWIEEVVGDE